MRDDRVDLLRFVGLAMVILAHVEAPKLLWQLRNFDVPLLILVSGIASGLHQSSDSYLSYVTKRVQRLLVPAWIFLSAYFLLLSTTGYPLPLPDARNIVRAYLLLVGVVNMWVIRVFVLIALVAPALVHLNRHVRSHTRYLSLLGAMYLGYELVLFATEPYVDSPAGEIFESSVLYLIPYALVFAVGLRLRALPRHQVLRLTVGSFAVCSVVGVLLSAVSGHVVFTQEFKYPPALYYLSYALGVSGVLWLVADALMVTITDSWLTKPMRFVAQNSLWVYLWHMPLVDMVHLPFYWKYPMVFAGASLVTFVQVQCVRQVLPHVSNASVRINLKLVLTG